MGLSIGLPIPGGKTLPMAQYIKIVLTRQQNFSLVYIEKIYRQQDIRRWKFVLVGSAVQVI